MSLSEEEDLKFREIVVETLMKTLVTQLADEIDAEVERRVKARMKRLARAVALLGQEGFEEITDEPVFDEAEKPCENTTPP